jgi:hypothetical protein
MTRQLLYLGLGAGLLLAATHAGAMELPIRKAGLWEMRIVRTGSPLPRTTMQHCTDNTVDREMIETHHLTSADPACSKDVQRITAGYSAQIICDYGAVSKIIRSEFAGDFDSAYSVKSRSWMEGSRSPRETTAAVEAKWLGVCKPDQKPGDIMMMRPNGVMMKFMDIEALKRLRSRPAAK